MNDDEIINLFLKRDENGIIELSTKYHPYCYKIAWNLLANREDAEECLNDTWFSVWHHMSAGSVKMNLYRNRKKLLKLLEKEGGRI